jgi:hypothetical protein
MFRVCAVHKFQSRSGLATKTLRTWNNLMQSQPVHMFISLAANYFMCTISLCFFLIVKEQCIASLGKTQCIRLATNPMH